METTLITELGSWNRQEQKFRELFGADALKDREFQKMKLAEYDRLYRRHSGSVTTTDEKALLTMLRFQRSKMEKALYPGILTRLLRRGFSRLKHMVQQALQRRASVQQQPADYGISTIPLPERPGEEHKQETRQKRYYARDLGSRLRNGPEKRKGQSL